MESKASEPGEGENINYSHRWYMGLQYYVLSFEAQLHKLSELINTNDWYGYGELNSFWIQQDDNFFMIEKLFW